MRIDNNNSLTPLTGAENPMKQERASSVPAQAEQREDKVELSDAAHISDPDRAPRIEELRLKVQSGEYKVSAEDIARRMVDEMIR